MIYFAQAGTDGPIKIGYARTVQHIKCRIASFQVGCAWPVQLLGYVEGDRETEALLHRRFHAQRMNGEWFAPDSLLYECADSRSNARAFIQELEQEEHWRTHNVIDATGRITDRGKRYLTSLELFAMDNGSISLSTYLPTIEGRWDGAPRTA